MCVAVVLVCVILTGVSITQPTLIDINGEDKSQTSDHTKIIYH